MIWRTVCGIGIAALAAAPAMAQSPIQQERVTFAAGASSATVKGTIKGDQTVDYVLGALAGQAMSVSLRSSNASNYFNVMPPGADTAMFVGSTSGTSFRGRLPAAGDYTVRVYLMRNAARRNESASYTISFKLTPAKDGK